MSAGSKAAEKGLKHAPKILNHLDKIAIGAIMAHKKFRKGENPHEMELEEINKIRKAEGDIEEIIQIIESVINEVSAEEDQVDMNIEKIEQFLNNAQNGNFSVEGAREFVGAAESVLQIVNEEVELEYQAAEILGRVEELQRKVVEDENAAISDAENLGDLSGEQRSELRDEIGEMESIEQEEDIDVEKLAGEAEHTREELKELAADLQKFMEILSQRDMEDRSIYSEAESIYSQIQEQWDKANTAYNILNEDEEELESLEKATP